MFVDVDIKDLLGESDRGPLFGKFFWYAELKSAVGLEERQK